MHLKKHKKKRDETSVDFQNTRHGYKYCNTELWKKEIIIFKQLI